MLLHEEIRGGLIGTALRLKEGVERDLRVDDDAPVGGEVDDHVGPDDPGVTLVGGLLGEVDPFQHAGGFDESTQLHPCSIWTTPEKKVSGFRTFMVAEKTWKPSTCFANSIFNRTCNIQVC